MSYLTLKDRVWEVTNSIGTGTLSLSGARTGYLSFSVVGDGSQVYYCISSNGDFEVGIGTYTASTLSRDRVLASTNSNNLVDWPTGSKDVFLTIPAHQLTKINVEDEFLASELISGTKAVSINQSGYVQIAMASNPNKMPAIGVVIENTASGQPTRIFNRGRIESNNLNYSGCIGKPIWVGSSGEMTVVEPNSPNSIKQILGVSTSHSGLILQNINSGGVVQSGNIGSGQVSSNHLASGAVTSGKLGVTGTPTGTYFLRDDFTWSDPGNISLSSGSVQSGHISSGAILSGSIFNNYLASGSVRSGAIASGQIGRFHIASGAVTSGAIASGSISQFHLASGSVRSGNIGIGQIGQTHFASGTLNVISGNIEISSGSLSTKNLILNSSIFSGLANNTIIYSGSISSVMAGYFDYAAKNIMTSGFRAGNIVSIWDPNLETITYNETSTPDLGGETNGLSFSAYIWSGNIQILANIVSGNFNIKLGAKFV